MKEWHNILGDRWEAVRTKGCTLGWQNEGSPFICDLAKEHGLEWYYTRSRDRVENFLSLNSLTLFTGLTSFGRTKCRRLIEILEAATEGVESHLTDTDNRETNSYVLTCSEVLYLWNVPTDYPLRMLPLSARLKNFCEQQKITNLTMLLEVWATLGRAGLLAHENIGRRTVDELQQFSSAIANADADNVRRWLPLNDLEDGLCLRRALGLCFRMLNQDEIVVLTRRLVDRLTLEESSNEHNITRERVRQYEVAFLKDVRDTLAWFSSDQEVMLDAWMEDRDWHSFVTPQATPEATILIAAAIEACFSETPQGVAHRLARESDMDDWLERLVAHSDIHLGGVDLQSYLDEGVPTAKHANFVRELGNIRGVYIDHTTGLVRPCSPSAKYTVQAILQQEEEPIPLTWLIQRVQTVLGSEKCDSDLVFRNRYRWSSNGWLRLDRIIWDE